MRINGYTFNLTKPKRDGLSRVYLHFRRGKSNFKVYLKAKALKEFEPILEKGENLNQKESSRIASNYDKNPIQVNNLFKKIKQEIIHITKALDEATISFSSRNELDDYLNKHSQNGTKEYPKKQFNFLDFYDLAVADMDAGKILTPSGTIYEKSTIKKYSQTKHLLLEYKKEKKLSSLFNPLNENNINEFLIHLSKVPYSPSNIDKHRKIILRVLRIALDKGLIKWTISEKKIFRPKIIEHKSIHLLPVEIKMIENLITIDQSEKQAKDLFLLMCYTGQSFADIKKLHPTEVQFQEDNQIKFWSFQRQKTKNPISLVLTNSAMEIIKKYNYDFSLTMANATFNKTIKEVCKNAGITNEVTASLGGKVQTLPKFRFVTAHTGRRTCLTNLHNQGVNLLYLRQISGHKSIAMLQKYLKLDEGDYLMKMKFKMDYINNAKKSD